MMKINKILIYSILVSLAVVIVILLIVVRQTHTTKTINRVPTSQGLNKTAVSNLKQPIPNEQFNKDFAKQLQDPFIQHESAVGSLLDFLPYQGKNFSFKYQISNATFIVTYTNNTGGIGDKELNEWLKSHGVQDRAWIRNLIVNDNNK